MFIRRTRTRRTDTGAGLFHLPPGARRTRREESAPTHPAQPGQSLRHRPDAVADVVCPHRAITVRPGRLAGSGLSGALEREAQRVVAQLLARAPASPATRAPAEELHRVAVDSLALLRPRAVGVETVGLWALQQLGVPALLVRLGLTGPQRAAALGSIIGRLAAPGSERATHAWLGQRSALGELLEVDFEALSAMQLYRASDTLLAHRETIEQHLFRQVSDLFGLAPTVTLYDLTNTYFEGEAGAQPKARRGHSKEKRSDCPLLTLGLVLDGSGFVRRSQVFAGNVREDSTLAAMLTALDRAGGGAGGAGPGDSDRGQHRLAARARLPLPGSEPRPAPAVRPGAGRNDRHCVRAAAAPAPGAGRGGNPLVLLFGGPGREGERHRRTPATAF